MTRAPLAVAIDGHCLGHQQTGNETYTRNLILALVARQDPDLRVVALHTGGAPAEWAPFARHVWPHNPLIRIPFSLPWTLWRSQVDLAHFNYVMPPICPCPAVVTVHDISYEIFPDYFHPLALRRMKLMIPASARRAVEVLTVSEASKREMVERYRLDPERVTVTHLAVSAAFRVIADAQQLAAVTARFAITGPFILAVGNLQPRKNLPRLLEVFARLRKAGRISHRLVLVGQKAWKGQTILAEIERLGIADAVTLTGYVSDEELVALYNRAEVFVYPSVYEGFGLPILESMACGTPVITANTTSMPEVAGDAALLIDPRSEAELETALLRLCEDPSLRGQLRHKGLIRAGEFSWDRMAAQTLAVYRRAAGRSGR